MKLRVIHTRDLDNVGFCDLHPVSIRDGDQVAQCPNPNCNRVAVRNPGLGPPQVECQCGTCFNANHFWIGNADVI
jgi:hypothetical protein